MQGLQGIAGPPGAPGPAGPAGPKGDKGEPGEAAPRLRLVDQGTNEESCGSDEILISAFCRGATGSYPLNVLANGANCHGAGGGPQSGVTVRIVCMKR